jgi:hypothetical protein
MERICFFRHQFYKLFHYLCTGRDEWMEQAQLQQFQELFDLLDPADDSVDSVTDDVPELVTVEPATQPATGHVSFLQSLLQQNSEVTTMLSQPTPAVTVMAAPKVQLPVIKVEPCASPPPCSSSELTVQPVIDFSMEVATLEPVELSFDDAVLPPLSPEDIESLLSSSDAQSPLSEISSPSSSVLDSSSCSTVDTSSLYSDDSSFLKSPELYKIVASDQLHEKKSTELYKIVANDQIHVSKSRSSPYSRSSNSKSAKTKGRKQTACIGPDPSDLELEMMSKKDRKKLQNKNAAIRYRMKKKEEAETKRSEVDDLEDTNQQLHEKVADLTRQISYMKDLINDVRKARGLPLYASK